LAFGLAGTALLVRHLTGMAMASPAMAAVLLGMAVRQILPFSAALRPGLGLCTRTFLRLAVVLLGLQVTLPELSALGIGSLAAVAGGLAACFFGTILLGAWMGVERRLARLIGIGTAVCGASAVVAGNSVTGGTDEDVAYALAAVTLLGSIAMVAAPAAAVLLHLDSVTQGLWLGASIHEVAQVVGAASSLGEETLHVATVAKMARVLMLAPLVLGLAVFERKTDAATGKAKIPMPWFVFAFLGVAVLGSTGSVPSVLIKPTGELAAFLLASALAAMGFAMDLRALHRKGAKPLLLAVSSWVLISVVSLALIELAE
jgi:uncharacterized integral membrane protein (TIGR00698 family)